MDAYESDYPAPYKTCTPISRELCIEVDHTEQTDFFKWFSHKSPKNNTIYGFVSYCYWMHLLPNVNQVQTKAIAYANEFVDDNVQNVTVSAVYNDQLVHKTENEIYHTVIDSNGHEDSKIDHTPQMISVFYIGGNELANVSFDNLFSDAVRALMNKIKRFYVLNKTISETQIFQPCILIDHMVVDVTFAKSGTRAVFISKLISLLSSLFISQSSLYRVKVNFLHLVGDTEAFDDAISSVLEVGRVFKLEPDMRDFKLGPEALIKSVLCEQIRGGGRPAQHFIKTYNARFEEYSDLFEYKIKSEKKQVRRAETITSYEEQPSSFGSYSGKYEIPVRMTVVPNENDTDQLSRYDVMKKKINVK